MHCIFRLMRADFVEFHVSLSTKAISYFCRNIKPSHGAHATCGDTFKCISVWQNTRIEISEFGRPLIFFWSFVIEQSYKILLGSNLFITYLFAATTYDIFHSSRRSLFCIDTTRSGRGRSCRCTLTLSNTASQDDR